MYVQNPKSPEYTHGVKTQPDMDQYMLSFAHVIPGQQMQVSQTQMSTNN